MSILGYAHGIESRLSLASDATSAYKARCFVRTALKRSEAQAFEAGAVLLVSELVTNAVLHTRTDPEVLVRVHDGQVWIGVRDGSKLAPVTRRHDPDAATGRGLQLVERVAARWGFEADESGKVVWFELDRDSAERFGPSRDTALPA